MKNKYKNITIHYEVINTKEKTITYYYKDKEYTKLSKVIKAFVDFELTYHFDENGITKEVHSFDEVIESLLVNYKNFYISRKYREEYSEYEYDYITKLKQSLLKNKLHLFYDEPRERFYRLSDYKHRKAYNEIYDKYKDLAIPKKVRNSVYKRKYFVVGGRMQYSVISALDEVFNESLYYEYGGSPRGNSNASTHQHDFNTIITDIFKNYDIFKIYAYQKVCYSSQELVLIDLIMKKLKSMKYVPVKNQYDEEYMQEYNYLINNNKFIRLFFFNIRDKIATRRFNRKDLENHKIKED
jgi:hypothetical protein